MTTKAQNATEQQCGALAGMTQADAGQARPILGNSHAVCRVMVEKLFGKRHWAAGWALALCQADPKFLTHLAGQPRGYAHFLCLIRLALLERGCEYTDPKDDARLLRTNGDRALLDRFFKESFPSFSANAMKTLPRLPKSPFSKEGYRRLVHALEDEMMREILFRNQRIPERSVYLLFSIMDLPAKFRPAATHCINGTIGGYFDFLQIINAIDKFNLEVTEHDLSEVARKTDGLFELGQWIMEKISKLPFPSPPWDGNDRIRPLCSLDELREAGTKFTDFDGPHIQHWASKVAAGLDYLYVCDHIPAMIQIQRGVYNKWGLTGWGILQIHGEKYNPISPAQEYEIRRVFHEFQDSNIHSHSLTLLENDDIFGLFGGCVGKMRV